MTDAEVCRRTQLTIQLPLDLLESITAEAKRNGQSISGWCCDLFEASVEPKAEPMRLVERVYRLEQIVARLSNVKPIQSTSSTFSVVSPLSERQQSALHLIRHRWSQGLETMSSDLCGADAGCGLEGANAARMARGLLFSLAKKDLVELRRVGTAVSAKPANYIHPTPTDP